MLVNATEMLIKARDGHYGVPQFNINNLEWTKSVLTACEEMKSPVILGVSEGAGKYMTGFKTVAAMVSAMVDSMGITVPVALHLDHGTYEGCKACIEAGFSSIMFDGSHYSIEENVEKTKELVALAHAKGLSIEAEVGSIGGVEDGVVGAGEIADPEECAKITNTLESVTITTKLNEVPESPGTRWNKMGVDGTEQDKRSKKANKARDMGGDVPRVSWERKDDQSVVRGEWNSQDDLSQQTQTDTRSSA